MIKILYVVDYLSINGGVQKIILDYYKYLDKSKITVDFLILLESDEELVKTLQRRGSKIYFAKGIREKSIFKYLYSINEILKENHCYDIVESHNAHFDFIQLYLAKKWKIPVRIFHAHSTSISGGNFRKIIYQISNLFACKYANYFFACSDKAARAMFKRMGDKENVYIINNAIESENYLYNVEVRNSYREKLGIKKDDIAICHIGRMTVEKNHKFLIDVFEKLIKRKENYKLILVGDGKLKSEIEEYTYRKLEKEKVKFLGIREDIPELLQGMDVFTLPSLYEGVPLTVIEAQASGVPVLVSDRVDKVVALTENVKFLPLDINKWVETLADINKYSRSNNINAIKDSGYDVSKQAKHLEEIYLKVIQDENIKRKIQF